MLEDNYLGRQIDVVTRMLSMLLLKRDVNDIAGPDDGLTRELNTLLTIRDIGGAEDLLFDYLDVDASQEVLAAAIAFYRRLNNMRDAELHKGGFSREEILEGLEEIKGIFGVESDL